MPSSGVDGFGVAAGGRRLACSALLLLLDWTILVRAGSGHPWSYNYNSQNGPPHWKEYYPSCGSWSQSPIDINNTVESEFLGPIVLEDYDDKLAQPEIVNNGHTVMLSARHPSGTMSGGCLDGRQYKFAQLHFHWGSTNNKGSEHTLEGKRFPMEAHFVHMNTRFRNLDEALKNPDGVAVLGVFFEVSEDENDSLEPIVKALRKNKYVDIGRRIDAMKLSSLLPDDQSRYYCYRHGSLTTPACNQAVTWTILADLVDISTKQLDAFRDLHFGNSSSSAQMVDNFRPLQELHGRVVYQYNGSPVLHTSILLLISMFVFNRFFTLH